MQGTPGNVNQSYAARSAQAYENANKSNPYPSQPTQYHQYTPTSPHPQNNVPYSNYQHNGNMIVGGSIPSYTNNAMMYPNNPYMTSTSRPTMNNNMPQPQQQQSSQPTMMGMMNILPGGNSLHTPNVTQFSQPMPSPQGYPPSYSQSILPSSPHPTSAAGGVPPPRSISHTTTAASSSILSPNIHQVNQEQQLLNESIRRMQESIHIMRGAMEAHDLATTLERASAMLGELGDPKHHTHHHPPSTASHLSTSTTMKEPQGVTSPKHYYELHMMALEELPNLEEYLLQLSQGVMAGAGFALKSNFTMKELYNMVQYCPRAVPRLYLQICAGSALMRSIMMREGGTDEESDGLASVQNVLVDLQESVKCVQCPIRGLFLRHYLLQAVKDKLPDEGKRLFGTLPILETEKTFVSPSVDEKDEASMKTLNVDPSHVMSTSSVKRNVGIEQLMEEMIVNQTAEDTETEILSKHSEKVNELMGDLGAATSESNALFDDVVLDDEPIDHMPPLPSSPPPPIPLTSSGVDSDSNQWMTTRHDSRFGTVKDSYEFVLSNFIEMNKLWVRIQHLPGDPKSKDTKMRRERERNELRMMVGTNLVRLSELEGISSAIYGTIILPKILDQIVACHDPLAQAYLMDCIIQVFPDEFHIQTLEVLLSVCPKLRDKVNIRTILQSIMNRLAKYHSDELLLNDEEDTEGVKMSVMLDSFHIFDECIRSVLKARGTKLTARESIRLESALLDFCLRCYPRRSDYIDICLGVCASALRGEFSLGAISTETGNIVSAATPISLDDAAVTELEQMLSLPLEELSLRVLELEYYSSLLSLLPLHSSKQVALCLLTALDSSMERLTSKNTIDQLFVMINPILKGEAKTSEYELVAKGIHLVFHENVDVHFELLAQVKQRILSAAGASLYFVPLFYASLKLLNRLKDLEFTNLAVGDVKNEEKNQSSENASRENSVSDIQEVESCEYFSSEENNVDENIEKSEPAKEKMSDRKRQSETLAIQSLKVTCRSAFLFLQSIILSLKSSTLDQSLTLSLHAAVVANALSFSAVERGRNSSEYSPITYEFMTEALSCYEAAIHSDHIFPVKALTSIIGTLCSITALEDRDFEMLITKVTQYCAKLLKKSDQCKLVMLCSHLFFSSKETGYRNPQRVLECLQRALKVADVCVNSNPSDLQLFVDILDCYLYHFDKKNPVITDRYISGLVSLIHEHISKIGINPTISDATEQFKRTIRYIEEKRNDPHLCTHYGKIQYNIME